MKHFDRIFYRNAAALITAATKGGTYPAYTISGWIPLVGSVAAGAKIGLDADAKDPMGDGTELTVGEKIPVEITVKDFTAANYATIRAAFLNKNVDVLFMDTNQPDVCYAAHGVKLYPKFDGTGGAEPMIVIAGERKCGSGLALFSPVAVS